MVGPESNEFHWNIQFTQYADHSILRLLVCLFWIVVVFRHQRVSILFDVMISNTLLTPNYWNSYQFAMNIYFRYTANDGYGHRMPNNHLLHFYAFRLAIHIPISFIMRIDEYIVYTAHIHIHIIFVSKVSIQCWCLIMAQRIKNDSDYNSVGREKEWIWQNSTHTHKIIIILQ